MGVEWNGGRLTTKFLHYTCVVVGHSVMEKCHEREREQRLHFKYGNRR